PGRRRRRLQPARRRRRGAYACASAGPAQRPDRPSHSRPAASLMIPACPQVGQDRGFLARRSAAIIGPKWFTQRRTPGLRVPPILDVTQAESEPEVDPNCLLNDLGRETIPAVADFLHAPDYRANSGTASPTRRDNAIPTAGALRHDPLHAQLAGLGEHDRALGLDGLAEQDTVGPVDKPQERPAPLLERMLTKILAVEVEEIEGDQAGSRAAFLCAQRPEVAQPIGAEHDRLAVEQGVLHGQAPHRLGDPRQPVGETRAVTAPQRDSLALLPGDDPIAVMFHLIPPVRPRWRA